MVLVTCKKFLTLEEDTPRQTLLFILFFSPMVQALSAVMLFMPIKKKKNLGSSSLMKSTSSNTTNVSVWRLPFNKMILKSRLTEFQSLCHRYDLLCYHGDSSAVITRSASRQTVTFLSVCLPVCLSICRSAGRKTFLTRKSSSWESN